jgi:hypothetical protein
MATHMLSPVFHNMALFSLVKATKFRRNVLPPSSGRNSSTLKMEAAVSSEMLVSIRLHIVVSQKTHLHSHGRLNYKSHIYTPSLTCYVYALRRSHWRRRWQLLFLNCAI